MRSILPDWIRHPLQWVLLFTLFFVGCGRRERPSPLPSQVPGTKVTELEGIIGIQYHSGLLAFSPNGKTLALPSFGDGRVELWSMETGKLEILLESSFNKDEKVAWKIAFSGDGQFLAVEYESKGIIVWDLSSKHESLKLSMASGSRVSGMAFADSHKTLGAVLAQGSYRSVIEPIPREDQSSVRWDVATGKKLGTLEFDPHALFVAISPNC